MIFQAALFCNSFRAEDKENREQDNINRAAVEVGPAKYWTSGKITEEVALKPPAGLGGEMPLIDEGIDRNIAQWGIWLLLLFCEL